MKEDFEIQLSNSDLKILERALVLQALIDELFEFGPISSLLRDRDVVEIKIVDFRSIFVLTKRRKEWHEATVIFENEGHARILLDRVIYPHQLSKTVGKLRLDGLEVEIDAEFPGASTIVVIKKNDP